MSPLFLHNGKLLINNGKLATSENCCCNEYAIFFCNSNAAQDPAYDVFLNNNLIGQHLVQPDGTIDGELWVTNLDITLNLFSCENCVDCANDPPWLPFNFPIPPRDPNKPGDDLTPFALCKDCTTGPIPIPAEDRIIRILQFDRNLLVDGNNTLVIKSPLPPNTLFPGNYGRVWVFKISKNPLKVDSILLSTAINDPINSDAVFTLNFIK